MPSVQVLSLALLVWNLASVTLAIPAPRTIDPRACTPLTINFDDAQFDGASPDALTNIPSNFHGFDFKDFRVTHCPGKACTDFPADTTKIFTAPRLAMAQGLVGGLLTKQALAKTTASGSFSKSSVSGGTFTLNRMAIFDIIDLPTKLGLKEDLRVHVECQKADGTPVSKVVSFPRNKDSAGYQVEQSQLGDGFTELTSCKLFTEQIFFPLGKELTVPTESMGLDNLEVCVEGEKA